MQLVPGEHNCPGCGGVYHVLCAEFIPQPKPDDPYFGNYMCLKCLSSSSSSSISAKEQKDKDDVVEALTLLSSSTSTSSTVCTPANTESSIVICRTCKCPGHYSSGSKLCNILKVESERVKMIK